MIDGMQPIDARYVVAALEDAGRTLLAMRFPRHGAPPRSARSGHPDVLHDYAEAYGWERDIAVRAAVPSREQITRMDEAIGWVMLIDNAARRRIVFARSLVHPVQDRHIYTWRRLGVAMGVDHKAVQRWHGYGIADIVRGLAKNCGSPCLARPRLLHVSA
jgi:hypothetical protein